jgi:hypothetical protein
MKKALKMILVFGFIATLVNNCESNTKNESEKDENSNALRVSPKEEYRKPRASCTYYEAQNFAEKRIALSGEILDRPVLGMDPVGCRYYFWCNVINRYGGMNMVHIVVSAESGEWEVISVEVE